MSFRITGLSPEPFRHLYGLSNEELARHGAVRHTVDDTPGFPDRITMTDIEPGGTALLLNYEHLPVDSPYRSRHAIFVQEGAEETSSIEGQVPEMLSCRQIALRGIDENGCIQQAELATGDAIAPAIDRIFADKTVSYIHAHFAARGCFAGRIDRTEGK